MNRPLFKVLCIFTVCWAVFTQRAAAEEATAIEAGNVAYPGSDVSWGRAVTTVDLPVSKVSSVVTDYARYSEFIPRCDQSKVLSRRGDNAILYIQSKVLKNTTTFWVQLHIYKKVKKDSSTIVVEGRKLQGNVERAVARWELWPVDGGKRTRIAFQFFVQLDLPIPSSVVSDQNRKAARATLKALRKRILRPSEKSAAVKT